MGDSQDNDLKLLEKGHEAEQTFDVNKLENHVHEDSEYIAVYSDVSNVVSSKHKDIVQLSCMCRVYDIVPYSRQGESAPCLTTHQITMMGSSCYTTDSSLQTKFDEKLVYYTDLLQGEIHIMMEQLREIDGLSSDYYRKSFLYQLSRDVWNILPLEVPDLYLPEIPLLLKTLIHHLVCNQMEKTCNVDEWTQDDLCIQAIEIYNQVKEQIVSTYTKFVNFRKDILLYLRKLFRSGTIAKSMIQYLTDNIDHTIKRSAVDLAFQDLLVQMIILDPVVENFPIDKVTRAQFLKAYTSMIESSQREVHETLLQEMLTLGRRGAMKFFSSYDEDSPSFRTYEISIDGKNTVSIRLNPNIGNNVGLTIWPGALYLAEYLLSHPESIRGKVCVEVGAGVGFSSIVAARLGPKSITATDYDDEVLQMLAHNLQLEPIEADGASSIQGSDSVDADHTGATAKTAFLDWTLATQESIHSFDASVILAADCIYDPNYVPDLVRVLGMFLTRKGTEAIVCNVIRNPDTFALFQTCLTESGLISVPISRDTVPRLFIYDKEGLQLMKITSSKE